MHADHLYLHVPFCARRCVYCDFSIAVRPVVPVAEYGAALAAEFTARHHESTFALSTLYFGGGTPSKLGGEGVARVVDMVRSRAAIEPQAEITLEANPEDVSPASAAAWRAAGVNRISLGIQSFHDGALRWMHRTHDAAQALRSIDVLRDAGLENLSIDLIFATPRSLDRSWRKDLDQAIALRVPHVSMYGLTVEPHTPLGRWVARSSVSEATEDRFEAEFLEGHEALVSDGFDHYEVSNYGRPGSHSRHNWAYWQRRPYAGLGPSAHEFDGVNRRWNVSAYAEWARRACSGSSTVDGSEALSEDQKRAEEVYLGLRTARGVDIEADELTWVQPWIDAGWATMLPPRTLRLAPLGWLRLDALASSLTSLRSRYYI